VSGEDVRISTALTRAGWRIRFARAAVADNTVVHTWPDYWHQHLRWARNVFSSRPAAAHLTPNRSISIAQKVESRLAAAGYADRVALLVVLAGVRARLLPRWIPRAYAAVAGVEVVVAVAKAGYARRLPRFVGATVSLFALDVAASTAASVAHLLGRPRTWRQPRR
jgi:Glycosyl transferase family group 2